jgi:uncharacterized phage-associated protein
MKNSGFNEKKFLNAVLFFAKNTNPKQLGSTKLNKLLFYSDFLHYRRYGRSITGDRYVKFPHGPVPSTAYAIIGEISGKIGDSSSKTNKVKIFDKKIKIQETKVADKRLSKIVALDEPDMSVFSDSEIEVLAEIAQQFKDKNGTRLSRATHLPNTPWDKTKDFQTIEYELSLDKSGDSLSKDYIEHWKNEKAELSEMFNM